MTTSPSALPSSKPPTAAQRNRRCAAAAVLTAVVAGMYAPPSAACSIAAPEAHWVNPAEVGVDVVAPAPPTEVTVKAVHRGVGPRCDATGTCSSTSCDDIATIQLAWTPGGDDRTHDEDLGVRVQVVSGTAPEGMWTLDDAIEVRAAGSIALVWIDGATDDQEPLDFVLAISELDRAGNESAPVQVQITHAGAGELEKDSGGCSVVTTVGGVGLWALVLPALVLRRRETPA